MNVLLDTHTLIWFFEGSENLSKTAREAIEAEDTICFISIVSLWEIAIKISLEKLEMKIGYDKLNRLIY